MRVSAPAARRTQGCDIVHDDMELMAAIGRMVVNAAELAGNARRRSCGGPARPWGSLSALACLQQRPPMGAGEVEFGCLSEVGPVQPVPAGDDEQDVRHQVGRALDPAFRLARRPGCDLLEGV